jgi:hypothetical protein
MLTYELVITKRVTRKSTITEVIKDRKSGRKMAVVIFILKTIAKNIFCGTCYEFVHASCNRPLLIGHAKKCRLHDKAVVRRE